MNNTAMDDRVSRLVELNEDLQDVCESFGEQYQNIERIDYRGSALVTILQFEESEENSNSGMLMFVYRYSDETDSFILECHMEVNFRTIPDNDDRYKFAADEEHPEPLKFVQKKMDQFEEVYENPPELMA